MYDVTGHIFDVFQLAYADCYLLFLFFVFSSKGGLREIWNRMRSESEDPRQEVYFSF